MSTLRTLSQPLPSGDGQDKGTPAQPGSGLLWPEHGEGRENDKLSDSRPL